MTGALPRLLGLAAAGGLLAGTASAQTALTSFDQLPTRLHVGDKVLVTRTGGATERGVVAELAPSSLVLLVGGERTTFPADVVQSIRRRGSGGKGLAIGAAAGFGVGLAMLKGSRGSDDFYFWAYGGSWALAGGGAVVGWLVGRTFRTVYEVPGDTRGTTVAVMPSWGARGGRLTVAIRF